MRALHVTAEVRGKEAAQRLAHVRSIAAAEFRKFRGGQPLAAPGPDKRCPPQLLVGRAATGAANGVECERSELAGEIAKPVQEPGEFLPGHLPPRAIALQVALAYPDPHRVGGHAQNRRHPAQAEEATALRGQPSSHLGCAFDDLEDGRAARP